MSRFEKSWAGMESLLLSSETQAPNILLTVLVHGFHPRGCFTVPDTCQSSSYQTRCACNYEWKKTGATEYMLHVSAVNVLPLSSKSFFARLCDTDAWPYRYSPLPIHSIRGSSTHGSEGTLQTGSRQKGLPFLVAGYCFGCVWKLADWHVGGLVALVSVALADPHRPVSYTSWEATSLGKF